MELTIEDISKRLEDIESNQLVMINRLILLYDLLTNPSGELIMQQVRREAEQNTLKEIRDKIGKKMGKIMSIPCDTPEKARFQTAFVNWLHNLTNSIGGDN